MRKEWTVALIDSFLYKAKYAIRLLQPGLFDVSYVAHPSFVDAEELAAIKGPLSISAAGEFASSLHFMLFFSAWVNTWPI